MILPTGISTILFYFPLKKNLVLSLNKCGRSPPPKDVLCKVGDISTRDCKCKKLQNRWALTSGELKQMHQRAISILKYRRGRFILDAKAMRRPGIETGSQEWESCMIPLHQRRVFLHHDTIFGSVISIQLRSALFRAVVLSQLYTTEIRAITHSQFYTPQIRTITMLYNSIFFTTSNNTN